MSQEMGKVPLLPTGGAHGRDLTVRSTQLTGHRDRDLLVSHSGSPSMNAVTRTPPCLVPLAKGPALPHSDPESKTTGQPLAPEHQG